MLRCVVCGRGFERSGKRGPASKYCSGSCRNAAAYARRKEKNPCPGCGASMAIRSRGSADDQRCRRCRTRGHGTYAMYKKRGCRCDKCKAANSAEAARYRQQRLSEGRPVQRAREPRVCAYCAVSFLGRLDSGQRFCSMECARDAQGRRPVSRFKVSRKVRLAIYEADEWLCQLCESPVRLDVDVNHPRYPTLDHIQPRALGGSDDPSNLRLACRQCNTLRGTNVDWVPVEAVA